MATFHGVGRGGRGGRGRKPDNDPSKKPSASGHSDFEMLVYAIIRLRAVDLSGNLSKVYKSASSGDLYLDMAFILPELASKDETIAKPHLTGNRRGQPPTIDEYLNVAKQGQKQKL